MDWPWPSVVATGLAAFDCCSIRHKLVAVSLEYHMITGVAAGADRKVERATHRHCRQQALDQGMALTVVALAACVRLLLDLYIAGRVEDAGCCLTS